MLPTLLCLNFTLYIENSFKAKQAGLYNPTSPDSRPCSFCGFAGTRNRQTSRHKYTQTRSICFGN